MILTNKTVVELNEKIWVLCMESLGIVTNKGVIVQRSRGTGSSCQYGNSLIKQEKKAQMVKNV